MTLLKTAPTFPNFDMATEDESLGTRLRALRDSRGLKQNQVAEHIRNVSQSAICSWEKGRGTPSDKNLAALAQFFGVSKAYLLHGEDTPKRIAVTAPQKPASLAPQSALPQSLMRSLTPRPTHQKAYGDIERILEIAAQQIADLLGAPPNKISVRYEAR